MSKVTLKIGDKFSSAILFENLVITEFVDSKIYMSDGEYWNVPLRQTSYYVNGVRYAKEDIIVPAGEEFEPITKDNIAEVLEHNRVDQKLYKINDEAIVCFSETDTAYMGTTILFKAPQWLQLVEVYFGKLKPLPLPKKANPFDVVQIGQWVRHIGDGIFTTKNKWYQRILTTFAHDDFWYLNDRDVGVFSVKSTNWDLTDIRDYNPDEETILKVGDVYINSMGVKFTIAAFDYINNVIKTENGFRRCFEDFNKENGIISVNGRQGKYVIPPFDFVQTLLDNGFQAFGFIICNNTRVLTSPLWFDTITSKFNNFEIKLTPENAKRIIDAASSLKELEIVKWKF